MTAERYLFAGLLVWLALRSCSAHAQDDETLLTARVCLSESTRHDECTQIAWATVVRSVAHRRTYLSELRAYSPRATGRVYPGREWITRMHPDHDVADLLPMNREALRWRFAALVHTAWRAVRGLDAAPCGLDAIEWGSPSCAACRRRMHAAGFVVAECRLSNTWWRRGV